MSSNGHHHASSNGASPQGGPSGKKYPVGWSPELLMRLDWRRFQDLVRILVSKAGFHPRPVLTGEAGVALISLGSSQPKKDALLCCAPWNRRVVSDRLVSGFHQEVVNRGYVSGTLFSPGGFTREAYEFQGKRPIELVSGEEFVEVIGRLPEEERDYLLRLTTAGEFDVPTCPACGVKLELRDSAMPKGVGRLKNLTVRRSETFAGDVRCNKLHIAKGAEAQFTKGVYANKMTFHGRAIGSFTCSGTAEISPGASVIGMVAARSINLRPGGVLDGEMKILDEAEIKPVRPIPKEIMWGCPNYPKCEVVLPLRNDPSSADREAA